MRRIVIFVALVILVTGCSLTSGSAKRSDKPTGQFSLVWGHGCFKIIKAGPGGVAQRDVPV